MHFEISLTASEQRKEAPSPKGTNDHDLGGDARGSSSIGNLEAYRIRLGTGPYSVSEVIQET
jgi:hypothetical protein